MSSLISFAMPSMDSRTVCREVRTRPTSHSEMVGLPVLSLRGCQRPLRQRPRKPRTLLDRKPKAVDKGWGIRRASIGCQEGRMKIWDGRRGPAMIKVPLGGSETQARRRRPGDAGSKQPAAGPAFQPQVMAESAAEGGGYPPTTYTYLPTWGI